MAGAPAARIRSSGVLPLRQQREGPAVRSGPSSGIAHRGRAHGRLGAGLVAVEAEHGLARHAPEQAGLLLGQGRAQSRHRLGEAGGVHGHDVDVSLHRDDAPALVCRLAGAMMVEEETAFVEERPSPASSGIWLARPLQRPAAEGDHAAGAVVDREHDAVPEAIVGDRHLVAVDQQAGLAHRRDVGALGGERVA